MKSGGPAGTFPVVSSFQDRGYAGFASGTRCPRPFVPFRLVQLPSKFGRSYCRHARLLSGAVACPHFLPP